MEDDLAFFLKDFFIKINVCIYFLYSKGGHTCASQGGRAEGEWEKQTPY